jgi:hypothetical protein
MENNLLLNESVFYFSMLINCKYDELHERNLFNHTITEYYADNLIKESEMLEPYSTHGSNGKRMKYFSSTRTVGIS